MLVRWRVMQAGGVLTDLRHEELRLKCVHQHGLGSKQKFSDSRDHLRATVVEKSVHRLLDPLTLMRMRNTGPLRRCGAMRTCSAWLI